MHINNMGKITTQSRQNNYPIGSFNTKIELVGGKYDFPNNSCSKQRLIDLVTEKLQDCTVINVSGDGQRGHGEGYNQKASKHQLTLG